MKKLLIIICAFCSLPALAFFEPNWNEVCPPKFQNIDATKDYKTPVNKYWAQRRKDFDNNLSYCKNSFSSNNEKLDSCYNEVRAIESQKNTVWLQRQASMNQVFGLMLLQRSN